jgi:hypothetical protein
MRDLVLWRYFYNGAFAVDKPISNSFVYYIKTNMQVKELFYLYLIIYLTTVLVIETTRES